jgi:hypothetical protein
MKINKTTSILSSFYSEQLKNLLNNKIVYTGDIIEWIKNTFNFSDIYDDDKREINDIYCEQEMIDHLKKYNTVGDIFNKEEIRDYILSEYGIDILSA